MNRSIIIFLLILTHVLYSQENYVKYLDEANKMYIKGDYESSFSLINSYFYITDEENVSEKAVDLGERIYYFYIRSLFSTNELIALPIIQKSLDENPSLVSDRVSEVFNILAKRTSGNIESEVLEAGNETIIIEDDIESELEYTNDELVLLLKDSLLAGEEQAKKTWNITSLFITLLFITFIILIVIILKTIKKSKNKNNRYSPALIGTNNNTINEFDGLIEECRSYAKKIDSVTGRKNNSLNGAELVYKVSKEYGFSEQESLLNFSASLVYDIGLLGIDENILKSEKVTSDEYSKIKKHVELGPNYLGFVPEKYKEIFQEAVTMHHENMDGTGYPNGIKDKEIPFLPRALRIVESYLSQTSTREYKQILDKESAIEHLKSETNSYDLNIIKILDKVI